MFSSDSNNNLNNSGNELPVSYPHVDQSFFNSRFFLHDITLTPNSSISPTSNSKQEEGGGPHHHPPLSVFYFPSPFEYDDLLQLQQHHRQDHVDLSSLHDSQLVQVPPFTMREDAAAAADNNLADGHQTPTRTTALNIKMVDWESNKNHDMMNTEPQIPRRRSCKKDRHSKINTARGPRDRRMRLSLEVARKFFGLQDVLGFDKASKTVEWLLIQAEPEIKKLVRDQLNSHMISSTKSTSSATSESCEVLSGIDEAVTNINTNGSSDDKLRSHGFKPSAKDRKLVRRQLLRKSTFNPLAKASREKARARARERTKEKRHKQQRVGLVVDDDDQSKHQPCDDQANNKHDPSRLSSWSPFETTEESAGTQSHSNNMNPNISLESLAHNPVEEAIRNSQALEHLGNTTTDHQGMVVDATHDALVIMGKWSPSSSIFSSAQQNTGIPQEVTSNNKFYISDLHVLNRPPFVL